MTKETHGRRIAEALRLGEGVSVTIRGWVRKKTNSPGMIILRVADSTGAMTVVISKARSTELYEQATKLNIETSVVLTGLTRKNPSPEGGLEVDVTEVSWYSTSKPLPVPLQGQDPENDESIALRHIYIRGDRMQPILKIRHTVFNSIRDFFVAKGYYEVHPPLLVRDKIVSHYGNLTFHVKYFEREDVRLPPSKQFYLEALMFSLENVFTIAPSFRAETSKTRKHLTEFWDIEAAAAWMRLEEIMDFQEELLAHVIGKTLNNNAEELALLKRDTELLEKAMPPLPRISYDKAIQILRSRGLTTSWGDDFSIREERELSFELEKPVLVHHPPEGLRSFVHKNDKSRPETVLSVDMLAGEGYGELGGGGERIHEEREMIDKMKKRGLDPNNYSWYLDLRRYGSVPHSVFGVGADRYIMWLCGAKDVREVIPFPRDAETLEP